MTDSGLLREQRAYGGHLCGAQKAQLNNFTLSRGEGDEKEKRWVRTVLLLFLCLIKCKGKSEELTLARYMEFLPALEEIREASGCLYLR